MTFKKFLLYVLIGLLVFIYIAVTKGITFWIWFTSAIIMIPVSLAIFYLYEKGEDKDV